MKPAALLYVLTLVVAVAAAGYFGYRYGQHDHALHGIKPDPAMLVLV